MIVRLDDDARLRRATTADLEAIVAIKRSLPMPSGEQTSGGGFLLGSEVEVYRELLEVARVWMLEVGGQPAGFSLTLDDAVLRASPLWARRALIDWEPGFDVEAALGLRVGYFDQLAVLPAARHRYWGAGLALHALAEQFEEGRHDLVLTTTVIEPIVNRAALPYLARVGAQRVGRIEEHYPDAGRVVSAVWLIEAARYREQLPTLAASGPATRKIVALVP